MCTTFFNNIADSNARYDIWNHYFPKEWKITIETLNDNENIISKIWLHEFFQWAQDRLWRHDREKDFDENLDEVSKELFPSVEPILWANLLNVIMKPWIDDDRMKSLVELKSNFGLSGRIIVSWNANDRTQVEFAKVRDAQHQATIELALFLFGDLLKKEKLQEFIIDLETLEYEKETREEARRKYFISIFQEMINLLETGKA